MNKAKRVALHKRRLRKAKLKEKHKAQEQAAKK
jgi:hypothetical protein